MPSLDPSTAVGPVALTVRDRAALTAWYSRVLGLKVLAETDKATSLGAADNTPIVTLVSEPAAKLASRRSPGLYHIAVLLPTRADLGRWLRHTAELGLRLQGAADHLVSEAVYLADPEGNGIEVYRDRSKPEWPFVNGQLKMDNAPLDGAGIVGDADREGKVWTGAPAGTTVGHIHLKVADLEETRAFYNGVLGFDIMVGTYPSALFVSAGGYHHHIGLNVWESAGGKREAGATGLRSAVITTTAAERAALAARLTAAGRVAEAGDGWLATVDPAGNRLVFTDGVATAQTALAAAA